MEEKSKTTQPDSSLGETLERDLILSLAKSSSIACAIAFTCLIDSPLKTIK